jgi:flagellar motor switch protein FliM
MENPNITGANIEKDSNKESVPGLLPFNYRKENFISEYLLRALKYKHIEFSDSLCNRLSLYLHSEFEIKLSNIGVVNFQKWVNSLSSPTFITYFKIEPLRGISFVEIQLDIGFRICERMLGGKPVVIEANREPTDIEVALLDQVVQLILEEWCLLWSKYQPLRPLILGHENDPRFLTLIPPDTKLLDVIFDVEFCGVSRTVRMTFQLQTIEPFFEKLKPPVETHSITKSEKDYYAELKWNSVFDGVPVNITAEWNTIQMSAKQIGSLKVGDTVLLPGDYSETIKVRIEGIEKFFGKLGTVDGKWAVELTRPIKS